MIHEDKFPCLAYVRLTGRQMGQKIDKRKMYMYNYIVQSDRQIDRLDRIKRENIFDLPLLSYFYYYFWLLNYFFFT